jgi:hypothetical protein
MLQNPKAVTYLNRISAKVIDGAIMVMAMLGSLSYALPGDLAVMLTVGVSLLAVALAHAYAETVNEEMKRCRVAPWRDRWSIFVKQA